MILPMLLCIWIVAMIALRTAYPGLEIGDGLNDADILHASRFFADSGYAATSFLPVRETASQPGAGPQVYITFPPGVFYLHELLRAFRLHELWHFRIVSVLLAALAGSLWFSAVHMFTRSTLIAALSAGLYLCSTPVIDYAGGLWEHLPMLGLFATLAAWARLERAVDERESVGKRRLWLTLTAAACALDASLTLSHSVMLAVVIMTRALARMPRPIRAGSVVLALKPAAVVCSMPAVIAALRLVQLSSHYGSLTLAIDALKGPLALRSGDINFPHSSLRVMRAWLHNLGLPGRASLDMLYPAYLALTWPALAGASLLAFSLIRHRSHATAQPTLRAVRLAALLMLAAMTWPLLMKQHAFNHTFVVLLFLPAATLTLAGLSRWGIERVRTRPGTLALLPTLAVLALLAPPLFALRSSTALNRVALLDARVYSHVHDTARRLKAVADCAVPLAHAGVDTLRVTPRWPSIPLMLDRPFYQLDRPLILPWNPTETLCLDLRGAFAPRLLAALSITHGLPAFSGPPADLAFLPAAARAPIAPASAICLDLPLAPDLRLVELALTRTIDRAALVLVARIAGSVTASPSQAHAAILVDARGADDRSLFTHAELLTAGPPNWRGGPLGRAERSSQPALLFWQALPPDLTPHIASVHINIIADGAPTTLVLPAPDAR
jgi:hypothetical protein